MPEDVMQNAARTSQMPLFGMPRSTPNSLNILSLQQPRTAPAPDAHDHVRDHVQIALQGTPPRDDQGAETTPPAETFSEHPYASLILSDVATVLPKRPRSPKALWRIMERLSASALAPFTVTITPTSTTEWDMVAVLNQDTDQDGDQDGDQDTDLDGEFFHARLSTSGLVDAFMAFTNEILETLDTFGRLYLLPPYRLSGSTGCGECDCCVGSHRMMVAYLTEGEVDLFEAEGIAVDLL